MDDPERDRDVDEAFLRATARSVGVDPDGRLCPNCRELAGLDTTLPRKVDHFREDVRGRMHDERRLAARPGR